MSSPAGLLPSPACKGHWDPAARASQVGRRAWQAGSGSATTAAANPSPKAPGDTEEGCPRAAQSSGAQQI